MMKILTAALVAIVGIVMSNFTVKQMEARAKMSDDTLLLLFNAWVSINHKTYATPSEQDYRYSVFCENYN
jgi:C1A family cysteine protease